jgi:hypothetical protein
LPHQVGKPDASRHAPAGTFWSFKTPLYFLCWDLYVLFYGKSHKQNFAAYSLWYEICRFISYSRLSYNNFPIHISFDFTTFSFSKLYALTLNTASNIYVRPGACIHFTHIYIASGPYIQPLQTSNFTSQQHWQLTNNNSALACVLRNRRTINNLRTASSTSFTAWP